ncbi:hypothetical protein BpHYR1_045550 [Brachionus plicatilis]|uniref:Uncharacterized protein n=1 Tax=Brachionus plicatilis TaxID=10195 RepID=A0A3M7QN62_BRAPC|nr:hypothetical protein BpHYR1_045550 [Brachionus plicatilis]
MRPKILQLIPAFLRNFNIEQRVYSKLDEIDHTNRPAPWHQSTAQILEMIKEASPKTDEKRHNEMVEKRSKTLKIVSNGPAVHPEVAVRRPKKENELFNFFDNKPDRDYISYGYHTPNKVQPGHLTLKQFDQFLKEIYSSNDDKKMEFFCQKNNIKHEELTILVDYLKPLLKFEHKSNA